jgi:hypothetical protein
MAGYGWLACAIDSGPPLAPEHADGRETLLRDEIYGLAQFGDDRERYGDRTLKACSGRKTPVSARERHSRMTILCAFLSAQGVEYVQFNIS